MAKNIMIQGTMSGAGKSLICTALCRIFRQDGYRAAPFKSQNMALNSFITRDALEMGRAQAVQALAAGVEPCVEMNPVLLKPSSDTGSQVIVRGEIRCHMAAAEYFRYRKKLMPEILDAYDTLSRRSDILVIEGAGSPAEINLKRDDIVNMGLAEALDAPVLLVGDIDRGGVFAQLYGTLALLEPSERERVRGLIINRFRGDAALLTDGLTMLEEKTARRVLGVVPYMDVDIDGEDSLDIRDTKGERAVDIAVVQLPHISNFTDFAPLAAQAQIGVRYVKTPRALGRPDLTILPGTKNTVEDLLWLRGSGMEAAILRNVRDGAALLGICGGYQMLGKTLRDRSGTESGRSVDLAGMGLLDADTEFTDEKRRTRKRAVVTAVPFAGAAVEGYEIHMGRTTVRGAPFCTFEDGTPEGCACGHVWGTYLHGLFDSGALIQRLLQWLGAEKAPKAEDWASYRERCLDTLAQGVRGALDMARIYEIMGVR